MNARYVTLVNGSRGRLIAVAEQPYQIVVGEEFPVQVVAPQTVCRAQRNGDR